MQPLVVAMMLFIHAVIVYGAMDHHGKDNSTTSGTDHDGHMHMESSSHMDDSMHPDHGSATDLDSLPDVAVCGHGIYPLYRSEMLAMSASPLDSSHAHDVGFYSAYMPNGAEGMTMTHGKACSETAIDATGVFDLPRTALCIKGNYPLFTTNGAAVAISPSNSSNSMDFNGYRFFMPSNFEDNMVMSGGACPDEHRDVSPALEGRMETEDDGLSVGGIAGIVIGCLVLITAIYLAFTYRARCLGAKEPSKAEAEAPVVGV